MLMIEPYAGGSHRHLVDGWRARRQAPTILLATPRHKKK